MKEMKCYSDITQDEFLLHHFEVLGGKDNSDFLRSETFNHFLETNELIEYWEVSVNYVAENYAFLAELDTVSYMKLHYNQILFKFISIISQHNFAKLSPVLEFFEKGKS